MWYAVDTLFILYTSIPGISVQQVHHTMLYQELLHYL